MSDCKQTLTTDTKWEAHIFQLQEDIDITFYHLYLGCLLLALRMERGAVDSAEAEVMLPVAGRHFALQQHGGQRQTLI